MHVLDIVQNSIKAGAKLIAVSFVRSPDGILTFTVKDDGCGMSPEFLARVTDPFTTTRTTRRVGLGIPMLKQSAEAAGGSFSLESEVGKGTVISASFDLRNIDCIPMGELCDSLLYPCSSESGYARFSVYGASRRMQKPSSTPAPVRRGPWRRSPE